MKRVLIIEDEPLHLEKVKDAFRGHENKYYIESAGSLQRAIQHIQENQPDLILADNNLPDGKGMEIVKMVDPVCPIILMTAYGSEQIAVNALKEGVMDYVIKMPESLSKLPHIAEKCMREWQLLSEQELLRQELRNREKKYRSLFEESNDAIFIHNTEGKILDMNYRAVRLLEYEKEELLEMNVQQLHPMEELPNAKGGLEKVLKYGHCRFESIFITRLGKVISVDISARVFDFEDRLVQGIARDITRWKETEQKLREQKERYHELNATKDRLFSILGHDLKNPMSHIMGFSQLLLQQDQEYSSEKLTRFHEMIYDSSKSAHDLLENLLEWSRLQRSRKSFNPEKFTLKSAVRDSMRLIAPKAEINNIQLEVNVPASEVVYADRQMVHTVIRNLLSNALKYTYEHGKISVCSRHSEDKLVVEVSDNGIGMSSQQQEKLFRFEEELSTRGVSGEKGTGMGLTICNELIENHGEKIWVTSNPGQGTTFCFTLPSMKK